MDKKGIPPLLYAASTGFGDSGVTEVLLKAGASRGAKTREGLTAAELVRKYKHGQLYQSFTAGT